MSTLRGTYSEDSEGTGPFTGRVGRADDAVRVKSPVSQERADEQVTVDDTGRWPHCGRGRGNAKGRRCGDTCDAGFEPVPSLQTHGCKDDVFN